jgi:hypothetical protein
LVEDYKNKASLWLESLWKFMERIKNIEIFGSTKAGKAFIYYIGFQLFGTIIPQNGPPQVYLKINTEIIYTLSLNIPFPYLNINVVSAIS